MNEEQIRQWMIERLYGEISPEDDLRLEEQLSADDALAREWSELLQAREWMRSLHDSGQAAPDPDAIHDEARRDLARRTIFPARWLAAAAVLMLASVSAAVALLNPTPKTGVDGSAIVMNAPAPDITLRESVSRKVKPIREAVAVNSVTGLLSMNDAPEPALIAASHGGSAEIDASAAQAESLFRTGLSVYNQAFTKVGGERKTLLESALLLLSDVVKQCPGEKEWAALAMTLMADSYRALDRTGDAIETYRELIARFPDSEITAQQARYSLAELMMSDEKYFGGIAGVINDLNASDGSSEQFATLALSAAGRVQNAEPEQALEWTRAVLAAWPGDHVFHQKAQHIADDIRRALRDRDAIHDWLFIGPFPDFAMGFGELPLAGSNSKMRGLNGQSVAWRPVALDEGRLLPLKGARIPDGKGWTGWLSTSVYTPHPRMVVISANTQAVYYLYINGEIRSRQRNPSLIDPRELLRLNQSYCKVPLEEGWNQITFKVFFSTSNPEDAIFLVSVLDTDLNPIPDLTCSTEPHENASARSTRPAPVERR
ncbi:MAG: hypothetical protein GC154_00430 [bacterium]|nr:hypothetical protein [bacterium]